MTFSFIDYAEIIWKLAKTYAVDIGVAYDMFRTDVRNNKYQYVTKGDADITAAHDLWVTLSETAQHAAYEEWHDFIKRCYAAYCKAQTPEQKQAVVQSYRSVTAE